MAEILCVEGENLEEIVKIIVEKAKNKEIISISHSSVFNTVRYKAEYSAIVVFQEKKPE